MAIMKTSSDLQSRMLEVQDENSNMFEVAQREREREKQWNSEVQQMQLADEITETTGHQYQEKRMVERLRGQLAIIKGSELNTVAETNDFAQKSEISWIQVVPGQAGGGSFQKKKPIGNGHVAG